MRVLALCLVLAACAGRDYGERCNTSGECASALSCVGQNGAHHCMYTCTVENGFSCPDGYVCFGPRDLEPKLCIARYTSNADCPSSWSCVDTGIETLCAAEAL